MYHHANCSALVCGIPNKRSIQKTNFLFRVHVIMPLAHPLDECSNSKTHTHRTTGQQCRSYRIYSLRDRFRTCVYISRVRFQIRTKGIKYAFVQESSTFTTQRIPSLLFMIDIGMLRMHLYVRTQYLQYAQDIVLCVPKWWRIWTKYLTTKQRTTTTKNDEFKFVRLVFVRFWWIVRVWCVRFCTHF